MKIRWLRILAALLCLVCVAFVMALLPVSNHIAMLAGGTAMIAFMFWKSLID